LNIRKSSRILVTGADGFIGSHLVEALVRDGHDVRAFVYYNSFNSWGWLDRAAPDVAGNFEVVAGDIRDPFAVDAAVVGCDTVLHLAALIAIPFSYQAPDAYVQTNVSGTLNILQAARRHGTSRVVCTSTSEVYGTAQFVPITEDHPLNAQSPYAATKTAADQMALAFHQSFDLPVAVLRPFNTYGPRQSARAVIPTIIGQIASGERQIKLGALHPTRDFTFVRDCARGFIQAAQSDGAIGRITNIGSGFEISIADTAALIARVMGVEVEILLDEERMRPNASEVERLFAGTEAAQHLFGWDPEYGGDEGFARGITETAEWFQDPSNLAAYKMDRYNI
jgi:NAD dependent epimerase/dehydratase